MKTSEFEKYYNVIADLNNETAEKRQKMKEIIEKMKMKLILILSIQNCHLSVFLLVKI